MQRDHVGCRKQFVEPDEFDVADRTLLDARVVGDHTHPEAECGAGYSHPDPAEPDESERRPVEFELRSNCGAAQPC